MERLWDYEFTVFELRHLRALVAIRARGSLSTAARDIHVTQSALSHMLKDLEEVIAQPLLHRKSKPARFTSAGSLLLGLADQILPAVDAVDEVLRRGGGERRLLLAMECHSCIDWLLPTMNAYRDNFADVDMDVRIGMPFDPYPALRERLVDVVLSTDPPSDRDIRFFPLFRYESVLICSPRHRLAGRKRVEPRDLLEETLITYPVDARRLDFFSRFMSPAGIQPQRIRHSELTMMIVQLVAGLHGVAALPSWAVHREVQSGVVQRVKLGSTGLWCDLWIAVRAEDAELGHVKGFIDTARRVSFENLHGIRPIEMERGRRAKPKILARNRKSPLGG